jgi:hypothetical protein
MVKSQVINMFGRGLPRDTGGWHLRVRLDARALDFEDGCYVGIGDALAYCRVH